jgi:ribulose-phosphate 3-epimerase
MIEIIPAILTESGDTLNDRLALIRGAVSAVQIDVVDGIFAPNKTWPYENNSQLTTDNLQLSFANEFEFELDLMVHGAEDAAERWRKAGAKRLVIHIDSPDAREALMAMRFEREERAAPEGVSIGIALPSSGNAQMLGEFENLFDYVQVMGIEKIGFQGQPFDHRAVELVQSLREHYPRLPIQVDGGVSAATIPMLVSAGATRLIVGSQIWKSSDPKAEIAKLQAIGGAS